MPISKRMTLQERLCRDIECAWPGIFYDSTMKLSHETYAKTTCKNCTIYEAGPQHHIAFDADSHDEKGAGDIRDAITVIKKKFPDCSKYNFTIGEVEAGMHRKILLTLE